jgi:hypothetical protein
MLHNENHPNDHDWDWDVLKQYQLHLCIVDNFVLMSLYKTGKREVLWNLNNVLV